MGMRFPHRFDLYAPGVTSGTPLRANAAGYMDLATSDARVRLQMVSHHEIALLVLDGAARDVIVDGMQVFWRDRGTWWTLRGTPRVFDANGAGHIEAAVVANAADGFFPASAPA